MSLRILIDLQGAQNSSRHRGIGRYSLALAKGIARNAGKHRVFVLLNGLFPESIADIQSSFAGLLSKDRFLIFESPSPVSELTPENTWRRLTAEILREYVIDTLAPDVVLISSMVEGSKDDTITSIGSLQSTVPTTAIVYDLIPLMDPDRYIGWEPAKRWYHAKIDSLRRADFLFAISQSTMNDAIRLLNVEPPRILNISSAADSSFSPTSISEEHSTSVVKRFGIVRKYLMHSSAFEARKNFQGLIRAFAALPREVRKDYQLVLACNLDSTGRGQLTKLASSVGLASGEMVLIGFVPDEDLIALYVACHLFVFPSFQEGFGLPALEAMCCGTPTIGANQTSVPEVIGRQDALFDPASVKEMTALILRALTDTAFYQSLKAHAKTQAAKFSWDQTALRAIEGMETAVTQFGTRTNPVVSAKKKRKMLLDALAAVARDFTPNDVEILNLARSIEANENSVRRLHASAEFSGALTWRVEGPFDSTYSLALLNRETARALAALGHNVVLHSTEGPGDFAANSQFLELNPDLDAMHRRVPNYPHDLVDAVSRNLYPPRVNDMKGGLNLLHHYAWEESGFPSAWVGEFNNHLDGLTCLSTHVEKVLLDNGVRVPMTTSGAGVDHWERILATPDYRIEGRAFRFLHVSSCFPRKGIDALLDAYGKAFTNSDDVSLIIKTFANPHNDIHTLVSERRSYASRFPHVVVIEGDLSDSDLKALYQQCHAFVAPSRAEGFGLPMAEAMLSGLPVITTAWSGQLDFCNEQTAWLVDYSFKRAQTHFGLSDSVWADPDVDALAQTLSVVCDTPAAVRRAKAQAGRDLLLDNFKWSDVAARLVVFAKSGQTRQDGDVLPRIGWITTWNTKCGIASYSGHLIAEFPQTVTILAPHQTGKIREDGPGCVRSWRSSKDENGFEELTAQIADLGLNTLILQFNNTFYNFRQLDQFIGEQIDAGRIIIVMMHATADPGLLPDWNWTLAAIVPALARCHRVLVHSVDDLNRLKHLGLVGNVSLFPHGNLDIVTDIAAAPERTLPMIASYGFCLPHKGLVELVRAIGLLRDEGTPTRLRLVNAEYPLAVSAQIVAQIRQLVSDLALDDLVEMHHDYLTDAQSSRLLQDADLIVFPYQQTNESASGAVRFGLSTRRPIAVTPIPIFADLGNAVHRLPGTQPKALATGIAAVLSDTARGTATAKEVASDAETWRMAHQYAVLSTRLHNICRALARDIEPFQRVFHGSSKQLRTDVGRIEGRSLVSTGVAGYLMCGPYVALPTGRYRIVIRGQFILPPESAAYFEARFSNGTQVLAREALFGHTESQIGDIGISLSRSCRDLEIRFHVDDLAEVRIDRIEIKSVVNLTTIEAADTYQQLRGAQESSTIASRSDA
jgi:glycosyltransferase involved in cell wall biosynthesis